jgi:hypothetical protein
MELAGASLIGDVLTFEAGPLGLRLYVISRSFCFLAILLILRSVPSIVSVGFVMGAEMVPMPKPPDVALSPCEMVLTCIGERPAFTRSYGIDRSTSSDGKLVLLGEGDEPACEGAVELTEGRLDFVSFFLNNPSIYIC